MRKLIVCNIVSLDGFFSGPDGNVMVMPFDKGFSDYNAERLRAADTLLLGRKSYVGSRSHWFAIAEDVSQPAVEREISLLNAAIEKVVVSNSLKPYEVEGWGPTRVVRRADAHAEVAALKERPGREILMFGSHLLWNDLLANGLVDELHFMIGTGVVGEGVRAFGPGRLARSACWTPAPSTARACFWPGTPSSADRDAALGRRTRRCCSTARPLSNDPICGLRRGRVPYRGPAC